MKTNKKIVHQIFCQVNCRLLTNYPLTWLIYKAWFLALLYGRVFTCAILWVITCDFNSVCW